MHIQSPVEPGTLQVCGRKHLPVLSTGQNLKGQRWDQASWQACPVSPVPYHFSSLGNNVSSGNWQVYYVLHGALISQGHVLQQCLHWIPEEHHLKNENAHQS